MNRFFVALVLLVVGVIAFGYYRNWLNISTANDNKAVDIRVTLDKDKMKQDEDKAKEKLGELRDRIQEKAGSTTTKSKNGSEAQNPGGKPPG